MCDLGHEVFYVMHLSQSAGIIRVEHVGQGGLTATVADIRIILKNALLNSASRIIVAHNHPSGNLNPSKEDISMTHKLRDAAALYGYCLLFAPWCFYRKIKYAFLCSIVFQLYHFGLLLQKIDTNVGIALKKTHFTHLLY